MFFKIPLDLWEHLWYMLSCKKVGDKNHLKTKKEQRNLGGNCRILSLLFPKRIFDVSSCDMQCFLALSCIFRNFLRPVVSGVSTYSGVSVVFLWYENRPAARVKCSRAFVISGELPGWWYGNLGWPGSQRFSAVNSGQNLDCCIKEQPLR